MTLALIRVQHQNFRVLKSGHFPTRVGHVSWFLDMYSVKKGIEEEEEDREKSYDSNDNFDMEETRAGKCPDF